MMAALVMRRPTATVRAVAVLGLLVQTLQHMTRVRVVRGLVPRLRAAQSLGRVAAVAVAGLEVARQAVAEAVALEARPV